MTCKYGDVLDVLHRRKVGKCCVQVRWKWSGTMILGDYKFLWHGGKCTDAGVGSEWINSLINGIRINYGDYWNGILSCGKLEEHSQESMYRMLEERKRKKIQLFICSSWLRANIYVVHT